jgi:hypothetical protein
MYSTPQTYLPQTPPSLGTGAGYSLNKSVNFNILAVSKFNIDVINRDQYVNQNNLSYAVDVFYPNGTIAPLGNNYVTGVRSPNYTFSYGDNVNSFSGDPQRQYSLVFKLSEASPPSTSSGKYDIYHNEAQISGVTSILDGTLVGDSRSKTGTIDINLSMLNKPYYSVSKFEIYSGDASNFAVVTGTGNGNLLKSISIFGQRQDYTLTINDGEQPANGSHYFYKILPYDDFGSGALYSSPPISGLMHAVTTPTFVVNNITGKSVVLLNDGAYSIQTYHTGNVYNYYSVVDRVANTPNNIVTENWFNPTVGDDFEQSETFSFKTIKYLAQTIDANNNVSSREILITDNSTSSDGALQTGLLYSEYSISDNNQSAQFMVSGSGYSNGTGHICLLARVNHSTGTYKLLRTIL